MSETKGEPAQSNALVVPDYIKAMTGANTASTGTVDSLASAAMSIPRISMRAKKFRFMEGGEEIAAENDAIEIVIFGVEPDAQRFIKAFYSQPYGGANTNNPPDCASDDGVRPSGWITNPVNPTCAECPKNRFGSATSRAGKPAKACRDSKRLWVARRAEIGKVEKPTLYALGVPVTSLRNLAEFGRGMKGMNVPISSAICKVTMDDDSEFPLISFAAVGFLPEADAKLAIARAEKAEWKLGQLAPRLEAPAPALSLPGQPKPEQAPATAAVPPAASGATAPSGETGMVAPKANIDDIIKNW